ncbi:MAG TPA: polysaccharide biosynthesis tyrosine autokinase [Solirubrobacteraceae bacterium]|jgi:succinoglycan biosynthesis transport protein ExoP|nr:polysaccharide biosynthesis tyrosine autokinase [Solirubrobacteraceae bacterium]
MSAGERWAQLQAGGGALSTLKLLRHRWLVIAGVIVVCVGVAVYRHERGTKSYTASASVVFESGTAAESALQVTPTGTTEPLREADTEVFIAHSPEVAEAVRRQLSARASASELLSLVKVEAEPNANVLNIIASSGEPLLSTRLANSFAEQYIAFRAKSVLADIESVQTKLQQQLEALPAGSVERANLQQSLQRLTELRAVAGGGASIIGRAARPTQPSGSSLSTTVVIGLLIGIALALAIVFVVESLDRRVKTIEEFEHEYRLATLTGVPQLAFRARRAADRGEVLEPYRILRSALDFAAVTRQLDTLMVTSAIAGEGKTTVAVDLAHTIALTGRRVVLMELDLRRPTFAAQFGIDGHEGLTTALTQDTPPSALLVEPFPELPNFSVLPAGRLPHNPSELLGSPRIADVIAGLQGGEGIVIVDAPPLNPIADAQVLLNNPSIHASLVVARLNKTSREDVRRARAILDRHMVEPVGIVVTGLRETGRYGYGYGYGPGAGEAPSLDVSIDALSRPAGSESRGLSR